MLFRMWRSQAGVTVKKPVVASGDDDDWETDPDFVVSLIFVEPPKKILCVFQIICLLFRMMCRRRKVAGAAVQSKDLAIKGR